MDLLNISSIFILLSSIIESFFIIKNFDPIFHLLLFTFIPIAFFIFKIFDFNSSSTIYLINFSCLKPPDSCKVPFSTFIDHSNQLDFLDKESVSFMTKVLTHSGQGEQTYLPPALHDLPLRSGHEDAIDEVHMSLFPVFEDLLSKTKVKGCEIDVLIVNCSGFCPVPSLSEIMVNKYGLRENVKSFNLSGMGCSASALAVDMANNILKSNKNCNAVVLSTEILSTGWYSGMSFAHRFVFRVTIL